MDPRPRRSFIGNNLPPYFIRPSHTLFLMGAYRGDRCNDLAFAQRRVGTFSS
jgi:hypothetical protein